MAGRVGEKTTGQLFLIVRFCQCRYITLRLVFISVCVRTSVFEATVFGRVCVCLLCLSQPPGRAKPSDFIEDAANYFLTRLRRLFHPGFGSYWPRCSISQRAWPAASRFLTCSCSWQHKRTHKPPLSSGILNPSGWCKSGQGQTCRFESCLQGGPVMALEIWGAKTSRGSMKVLGCHTALLV